MVDASTQDGNQQKESYYSRAMNERINHVSSVCLKMRTP